MGTIKPFISLPLSVVLHHNVRYDFIMNRNVISFYTCCIVFYVINYLLVSLTLIMQMSQVIYFLITQEQRIQNLESQRKFEVIILQRLTPANSKYCKLYCAACQSF